MIRRGLPKAILAIIAATAMAAGMGPALLPASAAAAASRAGTASGKSYHVVNRGVCLDGEFQFSRCHAGPDPDDPPSLEKWVLVPAGHGTYRIWNRAGTGWCLDLKQFDAPCSPANGNQRWARVSAGGGAYYVEHRSRTGTRSCLDVFWTFKTCSRGDKNQIWTFQPLS